MRGVGGVGVLGIEAREVTGLSSHRPRGFADRGHQRLRIVDFLLGYRVMASEGSLEGPSKGGTSPSPTDLKAIVKDSLRELLRDEPALFARRSERGPTGTSGGDAPGGKYHDCSQERSVSQSRPPRRPWTATWRGCAVEAQRRGLSARGRPRGGDVVAGLEADLMASLPPWRPRTAARRGCCLASIDFWPA